MVKFHFQTIFWLDNRSNYLADIYIYCLEIINEFWINIGGMSFIFIEYSFVTIHMFYNDLISVNYEKYIGDMNIIIY